MMKSFCAGVIALAALVLLPHMPAAKAADIASDRSQSLATVNIARIKAVLQLTPEQEAYWRPVEAALRDLARQQSQAEPTGLMRRIGNKVVSFAMTGAALERLAVAGRPLIAMLSLEQKLAASGLAREMGLGQMVAALN